METRQRAEGRGEMLARPGACSQTMGGGEGREEGSREKEDWVEGILLIDGAFMDPGGPPFGLAGYESLGTCNTSRGS